MMFSSLLGSESSFIYVPIGLSKSINPCSTSCITAIPVKVLVIDAIGNKVELSAGVFFSLSTFPKPSESNIPFESTTATDKPTILRRDISFCI